LSQQGISSEIARFIDVEAVEGEGGSDDAYSSSEYEDDAGNYNYLSVVLLLISCLTAFIVDDHADSNVATRSDHYFNGTIFIWRREMISCKNWHWIFDSGTPVSPARTKQLLSN
jgi:hypothetical protein